MAGLLEIILLFLTPATSASFFHDYQLAEKEQVLFARTNTETVTRPETPLAIFALPQMDPKRLSQAAIDNGAGKHSKRGLKQIRLPADGRWKEFQFWESGSFANEEFKFEINTAHILDVTDFKCTGDAFAVFNAKSSAEIISSKVTGAYDGCLTFADTPQQAWNSENFSHLRHVLPMGKYHLKTVAISSPAGAGSGAIRLEPIRFSKLNRERFRIIESKLPWRYAAEVCRLYDLELASLNSENEVIKAFKLIYDALGPKETAFIRRFGNADDWVENEELESSPAVYVYAHTRSNGQVLSNSGPTPLNSVLCEDPKYGE